VEGDEKLTISMFGCRMRNYAAEKPVTIKNKQVVIQAVVCIYKLENPFSI
jgi:hypothetical protein